MLLGQLSAKSHPAVAKRLSELTKSPYKPVRCLIQDNSPGFTGKLLQDRFSFFLIRRKKSLESKTPGMQAWQSQSSDAGSRTRKWSHFNSGFITHGGKLLPGVWDTRSTCICDQRNVCTCQQLFHEDMALIDLIVFVVAGHGGFYIKMIQKFYAVAGILRSD